MRFVLATLAMAALGSTSLAQGVPGGPPPQFLTVGHVDAKKGLVAFRHIVEVSRIVLVEQEVDLGDRREKRVVQVMVKEPKTVEQEIAMASARVYTAAGQVVEGGELWKRLKPGQTVLMSADGNKVDPAFLSVIRPDTLVIVMPRTSPRLPIEPVPIPQKE